MNKTDKMNQVALKLTQHLKGWKINNISYKGDSFTITTNSEDSVKTLKFGIDSEGELFISKVEMKKV